MSVKLYTTPSCSYCTMIKNYLRERKVKYTEYNVARDTRKYEEMVHKSKQQGVPVVDINGKILVGFDKNKIEPLLHKQ